MIICVCTGATDRDIRRAMADGAASLSEISSSCRAGRDCGQCHSMLLEMLERECCGRCPRRPMASSSSSGEPCGRS